MQKLLIAIMLVLFCTPAWGAMWYVTPDPTNGNTKICYSNVSFSDALTANTNKTFANLDTATTAGDTIVLDGGPNGLGYALELYISKANTISVSSDSGHNGQVSLTPTTSNGITIAATSGTVTINGPINMNGGTNASTGYPIQKTGAGSNVVFNDFHITKFRSSNKFIGCSVSGSWTFNRCSFANMLKMGTAYPSSAMMYVTGGSYSFNHCTFGYGSYAQIAGALSVTATNCLFLAPQSAGLTNYAIEFQTNGATYTSTNNVYLGCVPVLSTATSYAAITSTSDFWGANPGNTTPTTFDSRGVATVTNAKQYVDPKFVNIKNATVSGLVLGVDDANNLDAAYAWAHDYGTPNGLVMSLAMNTANNYIVGGWTAAIVDKLRWMVNNGHEVAAHGSHHTGFASMNCGYSIMATGTNPTLAISVTRSGDSAGWSGTATVTINGSSLGPFDLTTAPYNTIGGLFGYLNGKTVGDGTITTVNRLTTDAKATSLSSLNLAVISSVSISATYIPQLDTDATIETEVVESVLDLQSYINAGTDRNGNNAVTGMMQPAPSPAYTCKSYRAPNGQSNASLRAVLYAGTGLYYSGSAVTITSAAATGTGQPTVDLYYGGDSTKSTVFSDIYNMPYVQSPSDNRLFSMAAYAAVTPSVIIAVWHGAPTYGGTAQGLVDLCKMFGGGTKRMSDLANTIRAGGSWIDGGSGNYYYSGNYSDLMGIGNYRLKKSSPLVNAGANLCATLVNSTDAAGKPVCSGGVYVGKGSAPEIGAYEFIPKLMGNGGWGFGGFSW